MSTFPCKHSSKVQFLSQLAAPSVLTCQSCDGQKSSWDITKRTQSGGRRRKRLGINAPLSSKGTISDWKNSEDCMGETGALIISQRDECEQFFLIWITSIQISKRIMTIHYRANAKRREEKISNESNVSINYMLVMLVTILLTD